MGNNPVNFVDPYGLMEFDISAGGGFTVVFGWGKNRTWGATMSGSFKFTSSGPSGFQFQVTEWKDVNGAYVGVGPQYGLGGSSCPTEKGLSTSDDIDTIGGGAGYKKSADLSVMYDRNRRSLHGGVSGKSGYGLGVFYGEGKTKTIQYMW